MKSIFKRAVCDVKFHLEKISFDLWRGDLVEHAKKFKNGNIAIYKKYIPREWTVFYTSDKFNCNLNKNDIVNINGDEYTIKGITYAEEEIIYFLKETIDIIDEESKKEAYEQYNKIKTNEKWWEFWK